MATYNSYEEAKIANPECDIYIYKSQHNESSFKAIDGAPTSQFANGWKLCHPANHCMTVEQFLDDGHKLAMKDVVLNSGGAVVCMDYNRCLSDFGVLNGGSHKEYILRAAALEEKPKPTKFVRVEESIFDLKEEFEKGELYFLHAFGHDQIDDINMLLVRWEEKRVYRQVELDWVESVIGLAPAGYGLNRDLFRRLSIEGSYTKGQALILANAIIESLTDKPE